MPATARSREHDNVTGAYFKPGVNDNTTPTDNNRFAGEGTVYIVLGNSARGLTAFPGGNTHPVMLPKPANPSTATVGSYDDRNGSGVIDIQGSRMDFKFLDDDGNVKDSFTIIKGFKVAAAEPVDMNNLQYTTSSASWGALSEDGLVGGRLTGEVANVWNLTADTILGGTPGTVTTPGLFIQGSNGFDVSLVAGNRGR